MTIIEEKGFGKRKRKRKRKRDTMAAGEGGGGGGGDGGGGGGGGGGGKVDVFQPHPVKDQLPGVDYCVTSSPSWPEGILLAFQHYLVMLGTIVIVSTILVPLMGGGDVEKAQMIQTLLFVGGIKTLLQTWFGTRLPVVVGASFSFLIPAISVALSTRMSVFPDPHERFRMVLVVSHGALMEVLLVLRLLNI
ncbi:putative nucleobase-ascorbate transporter 9 [Vicia villosa]|uniref:putative nucleobase-ascorbate transporter 9 n=1 Tax=Vicia villosa TaxID=3911 RepID=UPI00273BA6DC|nr:putative nucleobase-ascorbate transporter 9 [Vicia villosa]XP_058723253.1 putative nucleobase-ascorbate transporter 9 [Vicia villosa]XP_058723254.1 putative nucleobase-ascorbate transporter 9 [Vicia villosa]XP_058723255.1 putative nucleobase-ascorbate transporter 9 [Vicia villosa]XP_058723256.1 putative nucleobase-ascorbate transporter 9 [Vicia villosa]XP_058723257.1 putative nucleobase-ascorbate transporter 9 [Vicia villosa]XP_058723258.1 putative nucleobase-ascorbate transporter 9 [Vicia